MPDDITPSMTKPSSEDLTRRLTQARYPRSNSYDARWVIENQMGPNALWLLEWLAPALGLDTLRPCARVLDLGCGRAMTSVFLAREYDVQVTAADLWVKPDENAKRIAEAGFADRVLPVHTEAHDLPFAEGSFDAIVSIDAYQYFGTNDLYLPTLTRLLKPGGRIGVVMPAVREEIEGTEPPSTSSPSGTPVSGRSTPPAGGGASGRAAGPSRSRPPSGSPTAGRTGCCGARSARRRAPTRGWPTWPATRWIWCAPTKAGHWASYGS